MMVGGLMHSIDLRCIPSKEAITLPNLQGSNIKTGFSFHERQSCRGSLLFNGKVSIRSNIKSLYNCCSFPVGRKGLCKLYAPIPNEKIELFKVRSSLSSKENSDKRSRSNSEDYISKLFREMPSQVEPNYLIGDKVYTESERKNLKNSFGKRFSKAINELINKLASNYIQETQQTVGKQGEVIGDADKEAPTKPIYLKDLLRQYKGELYVPEEAFNFHSSEIAEFNRSLETLPEMPLEDFLKRVRANQIEMLTSRAAQSPGGTYLYHDFIVDLKEIPGDKSLQTRKWSMHLLEDEAQVVFEKYSGPQHEVERILTQYVAPPAAMPHPAASSISSRVMVELTMLTSLITAAAFAAGSLVTAMGFIVASLVAFLVSCIYIVLSPLLFISVLLIGTCVIVLHEALKIGIMFLKQVYGSIASTSSSFVSSFVSDQFRSSLETGGVILFVLIGMTVIIRFTISRRPKSFRKWDLWQALEFSQSKPEARVEGETGVKFSDIAGIDEVVGEVLEIVEYLKDPLLFDKMGTKAPHGVLLEGPPGCGKTMLAKAMAQEAGVPFYQMAGSEFCEILVGVGAARVRDLFKRAKVNKPSIVFIDEIDALATRRGSVQSGYDATTMEKETTLNQLLTELDGFDTVKGVIFLAATNRMDLLDPALLRPGRLDRKIAVRPPHAKGRLDVLQVYARKFNISPSIDLSSYARILEGWTGAELAQIFQEAALMAVRHGHDSIDHYDVKMAVDKLALGPEQGGLKQVSPQRKAAAQVGMALVSHLLQRLENAVLESCDRISLIPRNVLSYTIFDRLREEQYIFERRPQLLHRLQVMLGGRAAEEVIYGHDTSMISLEYLPDATWLARKIISIWNLENPMTINGEKAPWRRELTINGPIMDFEGLLYLDYGFHEEFLNYNLEDDINLRAEKLLNDMYKRTFTLIQRYHAALMKTIYVLIERREISGHELDFIIDQYPSDTPVHLVEDEDEPWSLPPKVGVQQLPKEVSDATWGKATQEDKLSSNTTL